MFKLLLPLLFMAVPAHAQSYGGVTFWPKGVPPGGINQKADFGNHLLQIVHRQTSGQAELHQNKADVIVIQSGSASVITGGEVIDPTSAGPNEILGSGIRNGVQHDLSPGDVFEIPAGVPHQFLLKPGTDITYLVIKIIPDTAGSSSTRLQ